jgi:hypothetical protein
MDAMTTLAGGPFAATNKPPKDVPNEHPGLPTVHIGRTCSYIFVAGYPLATKRAQEERYSRELVAGRGILYSLIIIKTRVVFCANQP